MAASSIKCSTSYTLVHVQDGTGVTITGKSVQYASSTSGTTTPSDSAWKDSVPSVSAGSYLWTRTIVTYSDGNSTTAYSVAYMGKNGADGKSGTSPKLTSQSVAYQNSTSGTSIPSGTWSDTATPEKGKYTWSRTTLTYSDDTTAYTYSVSYTANDGATGKAGKNPVSVILSSESYTLTAPTKGIIDGTQISSVVSVVQSVGGVLKSFSVVSASPTTNGTYYVTASATGISYITVSGATVKGTSSSAMTADTATIAVNVYYKDFDGESGTVQKTISIAQSVKGDTGTTGAYTIYKYALGTSGSTAPTDGWQGTLPTITTDKPYLWIKAGKVSAGGSDSSATWSDATLLGTDNSQVYAKIEEEAEARKLAITNLSATGGAIESKIESYKINEEGKTLADVGTLISQTTDSIALKVVSGSNMVTTQGKEVAGIELGVDSSGNGFISLNASEVLVPGSVTAGELSANCISSKSFLVTENGSIRSSAFDEKGINTTNTKGFYLNSDGELIANNATLNSLTVVDASLTNITITGGEIKGDDSPLNTVTKQTTGSKYQTKTGVYEYYKTDDLYSWLKTLSFSSGDGYYQATCTGNYHGAEVLSAQQFYIKKGGLLYAPVGFPYEYSTTYNNLTEVSDGPYDCYKPSGSTFGWTISVKNIKNYSGCNYLFSYSLLKRCHYRGSDFDISGGYGATFSSYKLVVDGKDATASVVLSEGTKDVIFANGDDTSSTLKNEPYCSFEYRSSSPFSEISFEVEYSGGGGNPYIALGKEGLGFSYVPPVGWSGEFFLLTDDSFILPPLTGYDKGEVSLTGASSSFVAGIIDSDWTVTKYSLFQGVQKASVISVDKDTGKITYSSFEDTNESFSINSNDITIDSVAQSGKGVISFSESLGLTLSLNGTVIQIPSNNYLTSYSSIAFTELAEDKGTYVTDLYPLVDSDGNLKGYGKIGSEGQPFTAVHATSIYGALTGNVTGNVTGDTTGTHIGNVNGDSSGVNANATSYVVWGAVAN